MAKVSRKSASGKRPQPRSFSGVIRGCSRQVQVTAMALRAAVLEVIPEIDERFYGGGRPMAMYRTSGDVCWIQPHKAHCNIYFPHGHELSDPKKILKGTSKRSKHVSVRSAEDVAALPLEVWLAESDQLNEAAVGDGLSFDDVLERLREICLALPKTKETLTWGIPHFRVVNKIFSGCSEDRGHARIGLKMEKRQAEVMMKLPGITKAPYSRPGDGWVSIDPNVFDDWDEIERLLRGSFSLIAPKRVAAALD